METQPQKKRGKGDWRANKTAQEWAEGMAENAQEIKGYAHWYGSFRDTAYTHMHISKIPKPLQDEVYKIYKELYFNPKLDPDEEIFERFL